MQLMYVGEKSKYDISFKKISTHCVQIIGDLPIKEKGFILFREDVESDPWDYKKYKTVYRKIEGGVQFSDDGSVYVAPPEPEPVPEPEPYVPTDEELAAIFVQNKRNKINLSEELLESYLADNPLRSMAHNNTEGVYSVTRDKQTLMTSQYMTYQIEKAVNPNATLTWNEAGRSCEEWTEQEFMQLVLEIKAYVSPLISYQQKVEEQIRACTTQDALDAVVIDYGSVFVEV